MLLDVLAFLIVVSLLVFAYMTGKAWSVRQRALARLYAQDDLRGGSGNDVLNGGPGVDTCAGGAGVDVSSGCP